LLEQAVRGKFGVWTRSWQNFTAGKIHSQAFQTLTILAASCFKSAFQLVPVSPPVP
jgi:hypothetical protein